MISPQRKRANIKEPEMGVLTLEQVRKESVTILNGRILIGNQYYVGQVKTQIQVGSFEQAKNFGNDDLAFSHAVSRGWLPPRER